MGVNDPTCAPAHRDLTFTAEGFDSVCVSMQSSQATHTDATHEPRSLAQEWPGVAWPCPRFLLTIGHISGNQFQPSTKSIASSLRGS